MIICVIIARLCYNTAMFNPKYTISPEVFGASTEIAEIKAIVERSKVLPLNEMQLKRQALIRMVHTSTTIEGNKLAEFQVDRVLSGMSVNADEKSIQEVKNYLNAHKEIEKLAKNRSGLQIADILYIQKLVIEGLIILEKTGRFRPGDIFIVDDLGNGQEILRFQGPPANQVKKLVGELLDWLKKADKEQLHPIIKAAIFHSQFVHIHPFSDGNGRTARLLTMYLLYRDNWDFRKVLVLEDFYNRNIQDYKNALGFGWGRFYGEIEPDFTDWLEYFVAGFLVEARKVKDKILSLGFAQAQDINDQVFLDQDELMIVDFLTTSHKIRSEDATELLHVAKRTAQLKLQKLVQKGLLSLLGKGPSSYYVLKN